MLSILLLSKPAALWLAHSLSLSLSPSLPPLIPFYPFTPFLSFCSQTGFLSPFLLSIVCSLFPRPLPALRSLPTLPGLSLPACLWFFCLCPVPAKLEVSLFSTFVPEWQTRAAVFEADTSVVPRRLQREAGILELPHLALLRV